MKMITNGWRGKCPNCKNNLTSNDMPFDDKCPYCDGKIPFTKQGECEVI